MRVAFELPAEAERILREEGPDMSLAAREAVLVELYRRARLTHFQLAQALGVSRMATDGVLKRHGVAEDLMTMEEFRREAESVRQRIREQASCGMRDDRGQPGEGGEDEWGFGLSGWGSWR